MDSRAKQRLTGAIILVALFVLLVPELLTGPKDSAAPATPEEEGLSRYIIDLNAPAAVGENSGNEPTVLLPPVAQPTRPASQDQPAQPGEAAAPEQPTVSATIPVPAQAEPKPATTVSNAPVKAPAPAPAAQTPSAIESAKPAAAGAQPRSFVVQLGSFSSKENAERLVRDMTARGFATFIAPISTNGRELYRVRVGPTRDRPGAEALAAQLKRAGQSGSIVPIP